MPPKPLDYAILAFLRKIEVKVRICALCVWAHPNHYPHIERHVRALLQEYSQVRVYCIFGSAEILPRIEGVVWVRIASQMPNGMRDFAQYAGILWLRLNQDQPDAVLSIDPPTLLAAGPWARQNKKALLYFSMELWSELPSLRDRPFKRWIWDKLERLCLPSERLSLATVSEGVAKLLSEKWHRPVHVVRSIPPKPQMPVLPKDVHQKLKIPYQKKILVYQGLVEEGRGIEDLCEAILVQDHWHLLIIGSGPAEQELRQKYAQDSIHWLGRLPYGESLEWIAGSSAGAVYIRDLGLSFRHCLPGKVFEYAHCALPLLISPLPDLQAFLAAEPIGTVPQDWSKAALLQSLEDLRLGLMEGRWSAQLKQLPQRLNWENEGKILLELMRSAERENLS